MAPSPDHQKLLEAIDSISKAKLPPTKIRFTQWIRIIRDRYSDGLGFNPASKSRFSDPDGKFGIIYLAQALETSVAEAIIRDRKEGRPGKLSLSYNDAVKSWRAISINATQPLNLLNFTGVGLIRFGVPTDIVRGSNQSYARLLSAAIHAGPSGFDGIRYESRFTGGDCTLRQGNPEGAH